MSQRLTTSFVSTSIPGAYPSVTVKSNPVGLGASGIVVIMGEAEGGPSFNEQALKDNSFTPDQLARVTQKYTAGPIVDAFRALSAPSNDSDIIGTATRVFISKTNTGTKASAILDTDYGTLKDKNWGIGGNNYKFQVTGVQSESAPTVSGTTIASFGAALDETTFSIRLNGEAVSVVTLGSTPADHADISALVVELNSLLPSGIVASAGTTSDSLKLTLDVDPTSFRSGSGRSFELVESTPGDLTALGLVAGLTVSAQEPSVEISINRADTGTNETIEASASVGLSIGYLGTSGTLTVDPVTKTLSTTVVGGTGAGFTVNLSQFAVLSDLVTFINTKEGYSASVAASARQRQLSDLDAVTAIGIATNVAGTKPGRVKIANSNFKRAMGASGSLDFIPTAGAGLPTPMANASFLSGGDKGATLAADVVDAVDQLAGIKFNIIVPLFSRDAADDIVDGITDSSSTYTIEAVNTLVKNHCIQYSQPKLKRNRVCILSYFGDYLDAKEMSQGLAQYRCSMTFQKSTQVDSVGNIQNYLPWYAATVAAGMQAGGFYKSITNKFANVISIEDPSGFDSGSPGDVEDALDAGLLILTKDTAGNRWVSDQTTYGFDTNFVYNSLQAVYLSDILSIDLADSFQKAFVGKSLADVDASVALSFLAQKMDGYKKLKMIASSDDAPLGFINAKVTISGPVMDVSVEIKLATAIYFIPISISISQVQQSAE